MFSRLGWVVGGPSQCLWIHPDLFFRDYGLKIVYDDGHFFKLKGANWKTKTINLEFISSQLIIDKPDDAEHSLAIDKHCTKSQKSKRGEVVNHVQGEEIWHDDCWVRKEYPGATAFPIIPIKFRCHCRQLLVNRKWFLPAFPSFNDSKNDTHFRRIWWLLNLLANRSIKYNLVTANVLSHFFPGEHYQRNF